MFRNIRFHCDKNNLKNERNLMDMDRMSGVLCNLPSYCSESAQCRIPPIFDQKLKKYFFPFFKYFPCNASLHYAGSGQVFFKQFFRLFSSSRYFFHSHFIVSLKETSIYLKKKRRNSSSCNTLL